MPTITTTDALYPPPEHVPCGQCGAPLDRDDKFCPTCGTVHATSIVPANAPVDQQHFRCQSCGAEVSLERSSRSFTCPFCDSNYVVEFAPQESGRQSPEFVIGFLVPPQQAAKLFQDWIGSGGLFRPSDLKLAQIVEKLRGVYLPFWSFSMLANSGWAANIGEHWWRTEWYTVTEDGKTVEKSRQVQETEWWPLQGRHHNYYSGYLVSGSRGLSQRDTDQIQPFKLESLKRYDPSYLAGWLSEEYSIDRDAALVICEKEFRSREQQGIQQFMPGDTYSGLAVETQFSEQNSDLILLPVYLLTYRYGDKLYRFLVNGQTGKIVGQKPVSKWRVLIAVGIGLTVAAVIWWLSRR